VSRGSVAVDRDATDVQGNLVIHNLLLDSLLTGKEIVELATRSMRGSPIRTHFSATPIREVRYVEQDGRHASAMGLWFDLHCEWIRAALTVGQDEIIKGRYLYQVDLGESRILRIATAADFDAFEEEYATLTAATVLWPRSLFAAPKIVQGRHIEWRAVARDHDGIEIAPYRVDRPARTAEHAWYGNWDIASGCVWRPRGVRLSFVGRVPGWVTAWRAPNP
jgi:hypothetical protein